MRSGLVALIPLLVACGPEGTAEEQVELNPSEVETDAGVFSIHLTPSSDPFASGDSMELGLHVMFEDVGVENAVVVVTPFMPDMGHGVDDQPTVTEGDMGMYTATWTYSMAGYWEVTIEVDASEGVDTVTVAYEVE